MDGMAQTHKHTQTHARTYAYGAPASLSGKKLLSNVDTRPAISWGGECRLSILNCYLFYYFIDSETMKADHGGIWTQNVNKDRRNAAKCSGGYDKDSATTK